MENNNELFNESTNKLKNNTMSQKGINILILVLLGIALIIGILSLIQSNKRPAPNASGVIPAKAGFGAAIASTLQQALKSDWWKNLFNKDSDYAKTNCNPNRAGYNKNGILDPSCGGGANACDPFACDPNRAGYNMCGDRGFPCSE